MGNGAIDQRKERGTEKETAANDDAYIPNISSKRESHTAEVASIIQAATDSLIFSSCTVPE